MAGALLLAWGDTFAQEQHPMAILLVDDHPLLRIGLAATLAQAMPEMRPWPRSRPRCRGW